MAVNLSPRLRDSLDYEEPDALDARLSSSAWSLSLDSSNYEEHEGLDDHRPFSAASDLSATRKKKRQRQSDAALENAPPFEYATCADGDLFRLAVILPGSAAEPVECQLIWESSKAPRYDYRCLSYCWETMVRDEAIFCDGFRLSVTKNLLSALQNLRRPTKKLLIWIDQVCINQNDDQERGHQVAMMKRIFNQAKEVIIWLGDEDDRSKKLCEYAKKMRRGDDSPKNTLKRILNPRQLQDAIQRLLQRPWFQRVWVIPEVALARFTVVACGRSHISWENLVRLVRDVQLPLAVGFDKQVALLGNPRQRIAIITQMIASQKQGLVHTDVTQLLILGKSSKCSDHRDKVYAFYGMTLLTTHPDYTRSIERLYSEIMHMYVNSIKWETYYSSWHGLSDEQRTFQLMSILYSAGSLHQHYTLPSWVPDWTFSWHLAPIWCKMTSNMVTSSGKDGSGKDEWTAGVRGAFRAGGEMRETFEVVEGAYGLHHLRVSAIIFDTIISVSEGTPVSTPGASDLSLMSSNLVDAPTLRYGRTYFRTAQDYTGIATPGIESGDEIGIILGGDVPFVFRSCGDFEKENQSYKLLCECFVENESIMYGEFVRTEWTLANDVVLI